jgi:eukaryotic-like serine/threonine-protein kinase
MALQPGTRLGPYEILAAIGAGGMGEVYRARDTKLGRDVAVKTLPASFEADAGRFARFEREARVLASLNHPNVGAIYGFETAGDVHALVLELVEGETLADRLRSRDSGLGIRDSLAIARQIADALDAAHERGIVHRDLKPANIILSADGVVKVVDFGLAKSGGSDGSGGDDLTNSPTMMLPTMEGVLLGTAPYMSPEQARGKAVDKRTDIWAFGCVLYEMLAGRRAFGGETTSDTIAAILEREPDFSILPASAPPHIVRLLARALEKDPRARWRDIGDLGVELDAQPESRIPIPESRLPRAKLIRERLAWSALVLAASAAAAIGGWSARKPPAPAEVRFDAPFPPGIVPTFAQLAFSPDGRSLAVMPAFDGRAALWLRPIGSTSGRMLPGTEGAGFPFWSPDGKSIAFFANLKLKRIDLDGEAVQIVTDVQVARGGMWLPDGTIVYAPNAAGPLFRVPAAGGQAAAFTQLAPGQRDHRAPYPLPGGRHFLYYARGTPQARGVYVARIDGSEPRLLLNADAAAVYAASGHLLFPRQGDLMAQPFDVERAVLGGDAFSVARPVAVNPGLSMASLAASPSGAIAYASSGEERAQFEWVDRSGNRIEVLGEVDRAGMQNPSLSPDGRRIALSRVVSGNWDIWLMDARGALIRFTSDAALDDNPVWSADGRQVFFQSTRNGAAPDLYVRSAVDGSPEQLVLKSGLPKLLSDVSADGHVLLYTMLTATLTSEIWSLRLDGDRTPRPFVQTPFNTDAGQFSPDGRWVAYQSNESGRNEIYVQPFPGPGERIQVSFGGGQQVRWGRRGAELFYVGGDQRLSAVPVSFAANRTPSIGASRPLFRMASPGTPARPQYVVSADGQRFLVNNQSADPLSIKVILNWKGKP